MVIQRIDGRLNDELRPVSIRRKFTSASGSVLISAGNTVALCTASVVDDLPEWMKKGDEPLKRGWITAEYRMLPSSTPVRKARMDRPDGRATEIQRLIGRALRAVLLPEALGPRTVYLDCDILQADGGTRTLCVTGACVALIDALNLIRDSLPEPNNYPLRDSVAAVSVGLVEDAPTLDLCYAEDSRAQVDMNVVLTGAGSFIELQGTGEKSVFDDSQLHDMITLAKSGCSQLTECQRQALGDDWPFL